MSWRPKAPGEPEPPWWTQVLMLLALLGLMTGGFLIFMHGLLSLEYLVGKAAGWIR